LLHEIATSDALFAVSPPNRRTAVASLREERNR
jgi:hypothetical protein